MELKSFQDLVTKLSQQDDLDFVIDKNSKNYSLDGLSSLKLSSQFGWVILLKKSIFWKFLIQLDKKYWSEMRDVLDWLDGNGNGFVYLDEFVDISKLHEDATLIVSKILKQ